MPKVVGDLTSHPQLKRWYRDYRNKYFGNGIPEAKEVNIFYDKMPLLHGDCHDEAFTDREDFTLRINVAWEPFPDIAKLILIHEMNHLDLFPYELHGPIFQAGMLRLAQAGAFRRLW